MIKHYIADQIKGNQIYRSTYRVYPEFRAGCAALFLDVAAVIYSVWKLINGLLLTDLTVTDDIIFYGITMIVGVFCIYPMIRLMKSGPRKYIKGRKAEVVSIYPDHVLLEHLPEKGSTLTKESIYFCDLRKMVYEPGKQRLELSGAVTRIIIKEIKNETEEEEGAIKEIENGTLYIYAWYPEFAEIRDLIEECSHKKFQMV